MNISLIYPLDIAIHIKHCQIKRYSGNICTFNPLQRTNTACYTRILILNVSKTTNVGNVYHAYRRKISKYIFELNISRYPVYYPIFFYICVYVCVSGVEGGGGG